MSKPIRHHYIPQFWLKTFCEDQNDGYVRYIDIKTGNLNKTYRTLIHL